MRGNTLIIAYSFFFIDCTYLYIEQPPIDVDCNPYVKTDEGLLLQCALTAPTASVVDINWYHNEQIQHGELHIETNNNETIYRSTLLLMELQPATDSGDYYCQASADGEDLLPSETLTLSNDESAYLTFIECINKGSHFSSATKCADTHEHAGETSPSSLLVQCCMLPG